MTDRWSSFKDRELRIIAEALASQDERLAVRMAEEVALEAEERGPFRARHILAFEKASTA